MDWKTQCCKDINSSKIELLIQSNPNQNLTRIIGWNIKADSNIDMQINSQSNKGGGEKEEEEESWKTHITW